MTAGLSRETAIAVGATALALAAMAYDHLVPGDPWGFAIGSAVSVVLAALLGRGGGRGVRGDAAEVIGVAVILLAAAAYAVGGSDETG